MNLLVLLSLALCSWQPARVLAADSAITDRFYIATATEPDYIIIGGGLAGLTVANRLSADPKVTVLVVEAGQDDREDPLVKTLDSYSQSFGSRLDWNFAAENQVGGTKYIHAGKTLGGSSSINGATWTRGAKEQYDALEGLGLTGWTWDSLLPYFKKAEHFYPPRSAQRALGAAYDADVHGSNGPIDASFTPADEASSHVKRMYTDRYGAEYLESAAAAIGLRTVKDMTSGDVHGTGAMTLHSITPSDTAQLRSSAATGYLSPIEYSRPNLHVLKGWIGVRAHFDSSNPTKVTGVSLQKRVDGPIKVANATKGVILAAGAIRTPQFLELSGIGDSAILDPLGIQTVVDLKGVGKNLQDQALLSMGYKNKQPFQGEGPGGTIAFPNIYQLFANASAIRTDLEAKLDAMADRVVQRGGAVSAATIKTHWKSLIQQIWTHNVSTTELFLDHGFPKGTLGQDTWNLLVFSRGSTHIKNQSAWSHPHVDPAYLHLGIDVDLSIASLRTARKIFQTSPIADSLGEEIVPGTQRVPNDADYGSWAAWRKILPAYAAVAHQIGTCQMGTSPEAGAVVDGSGRVHGIAEGSLRIVDASILPMQLSAHLSSTVYAFAEKLADEIINGN